VFNAAMLKRDPVYSFDLKALLEAWFAVWLVRNPQQSSDAVLKITSLNCDLIDDEIHLSGTVSVTDSISFTIGEIWKLLQGYIGAGPWPNEFLLATICKIDANGITYHPTIKHNYAMFREVSGMTMTTYRELRSSVGPSTADDPLAKFANPHRTLLVGNFSLTPLFDHILFLWSQKRLPQYDYVLRVCKQGTSSIEEAIHRCLPSGITMPALTNRVLLLLDNVDVSIVGDTPVDVIASSSVRRDDWTVIDGIELSDIGLNDILSAHKDAPTDVYDLITIDGEIAPLYRNPWILDLVLRRVRAIVADGYSPFAVEESAVARSLFRYNKMHHIYEHCSDRDFYRHFESDLMALETMAFNHACGRSFTIDPTRRFHLYQMGLLDGDRIICPNYFVSKYLERNLTEDNAMELKANLSPTVIAYTAEVGLEYF
jgi:hypothetical protein